MVLMPVAPVLAQEAENFIFSAPDISEDLVKTTNVDGSEKDITEVVLLDENSTVVVDPFVAPLLTNIESVQNVVITESVTVPDSSSTIFLNATTTTQVDIGLNTSTESILINFSTGTPAIVLETSTIFESKIDSFVSTTVSLIEKIKTNIEVLAEKIVDVPVIHFDDESFLKQITFSEVVRPAIEGGSTFKVVDEKTDVSSLGDGKMMYRIYKNRRSIYDDPNSGEKKERPIGWNLYFENTKSRIFGSNNAGYEFVLPYDNTDIKITAGNLEIGNRIFHPLIPVFSRELKNDKSIDNIFQNVYRGVDVQFNDAREKRERVVVIKDKPDMVADEQLLVWEKYQIPAGYDFWYGEDQKRISGTVDIGKEIVYIKNNENKVIELGSAMVFDSSENETHSKIVERKAVFDESSNVLSVGIVLDGEYLLSRDTLYPVYIDPTYSICRENYSGSAWSCFMMNDLYMRQTEGDYKDYDQSASTGSRDLAVGFYNESVTAKWSRAMFVFFDSSFSDLSLNASVGSASLNMYYNSSRVGLGTYNGTISLAARRVLSNVPKFSTVYSNVKNNMQDISTTNITVGSGGWKSWNITGDVQGWAGNYLINNGIVIEPTPAWTSGTSPTGWPNKVLFFKASEDGGSEGAYLDVLVKRPDYSIQNSSINKYNFNAGENVNGFVTVQNIGSHNANQNLNVDYYLNQGACVSGATITNYSINPPSVGSPVTNNFSFNLSPSLASGSYCLSYMVNNPTVLEETKSNNSGSFNITINQSAKPDLYYNSNPVIPANVKPGINYNINVDVYNGGNGTASNVAVELYWDNVYQSTKYYMDLAAYSSQSQVNSFVIPSNASVGNHTIKFHIVPVSGETNTSNNDFSGTAYAISSPVLFISDFNLSGGTYFSGNNISVTTQVQNVGTGAANYLPYYIKIVKTSDSSVSYNLNTFSGTVSIPSGITQTISFSGALPASVNDFQTNYYVVLSINGGGNPTKQGNGTIVVQQYNYGGGGGSGSTLDTDGDGVPNTAEITIGSKVNGTNTIKPVDKNKTLTVKSNKVDGVAPKSAGTAVASQVAQGSVFGGDPVNMRTGALEFDQTDFRLGGRGIGLNLVRTYDSKLSDFSGRLGNGWFDSYDIYYAQDAVSKDVQVYLGGHLAAYFTCPSHDGETYVPEVGRYETLTKNAVTGLLDYRTAEGIKYVFGKSVGGGAVVLATQIVDTNNNAVTLGYTTVREVPLLSSISDSSGRQLTFTYPADTDLLWDKIKEVRETVSGVSRLVARYTYDTNKNLTAVHQESSYSAEVVKNIDHTFSYDAAGRMLTYTDSRGTILYNEYDATGRVLKQYEKNPRISNNDKRLIYDFIYTDSTDTNVSGSTHCTLIKNYRDNSNYYDEYLCFNSSELKIYSKKGSNVEKWEYNADGMATKHTDALSNVTNYVYDAKRRLISQTPADSTDWHTVITFEYENNFNRLTKKTETVTALTGKTPPAPRVTNFTIDSATGNLTAVQYPDGLSESFQYDVYGNVKKYTNKNNAVTDFIYDNNGNYLTSETVTVTQADSTSQTIKKQYGYDGYGHRTSYLDPNGKTYSYGYDSRGNMRFESDPLANSKYYKYDEEDHKTSDTDALGREIQYVFDTDINASLLSVTKVSGSGNIINSRQYDYVGNVVKEIDGNGNNKTYTYTAENWLLNTADAKRTITNEYYVNGWLKKQTDSEGRRTDYFYDSRGNKTETRTYYDATNFISNKFVYDGLNRLVSQTDGKNNVTTFVYDMMDRLTTSTDAKGGVTIYFYDAVGNKIGERSPRASVNVILRNSHGYSTAYFYDAANRLIKKVNANDKAILYIYNANGNVLKTIENQNSDGTSATHVSQTTYFDNNWKKTETDAEGGVVQYTYEKVGTVKTKTSAAGLVTSYTYDDFSRLIKETDNAGLATDYQYDANNNKIAVTYPDTTKTQYIYNALNQILTVKDALNGTRAFEYDGANNKTKETNKLGKATNFVYDKLNRLSQETNPAGTITAYTYDNNSNRTAETVGAKTTAYEYDELNRNTKIIYPGNKSESVTYDANGNIATKTDGKGQKITYTSDKLNRQTSKLLPGGFTVQYVYDNWNNLTNLTDESGTTQYVYDNLNRNTTETKSFVGLTGKNYVIVRAYNADSQLSALTDGANRKFDYTYNTRGMLDNVKHGATTLAKYTYSNFGKPSLIEYGNGIKTNLVHDGLNRVVNIETNSGTTTLFSQKFTYDAQSNRTAMVEDKNSTTTYSYDDLEQLTNVNINNNGNNSVLGYNYDIYGNRTITTNPLSSANYTYVSGTNELDKVVYNNRLSVASLFDGNGSLSKETFTKLGKTDKEIVYTWDNQNRLSQINYQYTNRPAFMPAVPDNTLNFTYDDFNNRTKKQATNGTLTYYIKSGNTVLY